MSRSSTRYLMLFSALVQLLLGIALTFAPTEVLRAAGALPLPPLVLLAQIAGALYLGFAMLNWMAKDNLIGGIYSRPVAMGNFLHFFIVALALLKGFASLPHSPGTFALLILYALLGLAFAFVLFRYPKTD